MSGRFGAYDLTAGTAQSLAQGTTDRYTACSVSLCNRNNQPVKVGIAITSTVNAISGLEYIDEGVELLPNTVLERTGIAIKKGEYITVISDGARISATAWGVSAGDPDSSVVAIHSIMQIEFGCGETPTRPGYSTCDIRNLPDIDYVCPAWEINKHIQSNTVTHIYSRHFLEHLTFAQGRIWLSACLDILAPGGEQIICLPNMRFHVQQWINGNALEHARAGFWGWQREGETELWDVHKSGYTDEQLVALVTELGYKNARSTRPLMNKHLEIVCYK